MSTQSDTPRINAGPRPAEAELAKTLEAAIKRFKMYPSDHPACKSASDGPFSILKTLFKESEFVVLGMADSYLTVNNMSSEMNANASIICCAMKELELKSIVLKEGISPEELGRFLTYFTTKVAKTEPWGSLTDYIATNNLDHIAIDSYRYELVGDDEKVVSADIATGVGRGLQSVKVEFMRLVDDHPELTLDLLTSDDNAKHAISALYAGAIDFDELKEEAESCAATLSEEQMLQLVAAGLKKRLLEGEKIDLVDLEQALFGIKSVVEKIKRPELIPKIRRLIEKLNLVDGHHLDLIFDAEQSIKILVCRELNESTRDLDRGIVDLDEVRRIPKRLHILGNTEHSVGVTRAIFAKAFSNESVRSDDMRMAEVVAEFVDSAIKIESETICMASVDCTVNALSNVSIPIPRFKSLVSIGLKLCRWMLVHQRLSDLYRVVYAVNRFRSGEAACSDKHTSVTIEFTEMLATPEMVGRLVEILKARTEEHKKVMYDILNILPTQASALTLCQLMDCPDSVVRLLALRVLSNYEDVTLKALGSVLDDIEPQIRSRKNPRLRQDMWYRLRNIVFVAGNIVRDDAVKIIERLVGDPDSRLAEEIIVALEKIGGEQASILLTGYLHYPDEAIRRRAAISVGDMRDKKAIPHLVEAYRRNPELRVQLAPILANIGGEEVIDFLMEAASQPSGFFDQVLNKSGDDEKIAAVTALSQIVSRKSLRILKRLRRNHRVRFNGLFGSKSVQVAINNAIQRLEKQLRTGQNGM